ncbi:MAG: BrnT family toxin [Fibrobacter sp.]|nr:BrnT family toxin [Fibrobacter sp.]MBR5412752.1 BrnT family toxin [Fibrobacter sp.]
MKIIKHAFEKFDERAFTPEMAAKIVKGNRILISSKSNPDRYIAIGKIDGDIWIVVLEKDLYTVVTARRAHKNEENLWNSR